MTPRWGGWLIALSFVVAFLLTALPLPAALGWGRPEWVSLVLIYWVIALPQRVGVLVAFVVGLLLDLLEGAALGQNALALSVVAYLSLSLYQRLRLYNLWQQAALVFLMVGSGQLLGLWLQGLSGAGSINALFLVSTLVSALLWPAVLTVLRYLRRRYKIA